MIGGLTQYPLGTQDVAIADGAALDAFGRQRVSWAKTLFDSQQEYGLDTRTTWDAVVYDSSLTTATYSITTPSSNGSASDAAGNAVGPRNANSRMVPITVSADSGDFAILQSRQFVRYIPGKSQAIFMTGIFAQTTNDTVKIIRRTGTSGSASDADAIAQSSWNIDKMDGTGPSGITIDFTKTQILVIDAQWLGVGRVRVGFDINGILYYVHEFKNANVLAVPYTQTFNLPVRFEAVNSAGSTIFRGGYFSENNGIFLETTSANSGGTYNFICCSVQTESGDETRGFPQSASNGITTIGVTTRRPILSVRPKATFNSIDNRSHIELADFEVIAQTNHAYIEVVIGGTLTGASWTSVGTDSVAEYDVASTAISGGVSIIKGFVSSSGTGSKAIGASGGMIDVRNPLTLSKINSLTATQIPMSIVATSFSATSTLSAALNWHEQTI